MRPLILLSGLAAGGAEQVTVGFLRRLAEEGRPVPLCTLTARTDGAPAAEAAAAGLERHDLGARRLVDPLAMARLIRLVRGGGYDLVHAHGQDASIAAAWARRLVPFRLVVSRHVVDEPGDGLRQRVRAALALSALRRSDAPVAVSRAAAERLTELTRLPATRIRVIPNGIDLEAFDPEAHGERARAVRHGLGLRHDESVVLMPAVLRPGKGHDLLMEALPLVLRAVPGARFLLAGAGELEGELRERARGFGDRVLFLGHRDDVPTLLAASDVVVLPSRSEALPTVALEAAAAGKALVASRVGGVPEVVDDGRTGILTPPGDAAALAAALVGLLVDPDRRGTLGKAARQRALARFGIDRQVASTLELWERTAAGGHP